jgi:hypothetical protein
MAVTHDAVTPIRQLYILPQGDEGVGFGDQHRSQHSSGAFTGKFGQGIINGVRLTQLNDGGISRHGVSLLPGGSGRLSPASIRRLSQTVVTQIQP